MLAEIQYTARDFESIVEFLKSVVTAENPDLWNDFFESNIGMNIIDMIAAQGDVLSYVANQIAQEVFLTTCRRYASGLKYASGVGYSIRGRSSASVTIEAIPPFPAILATQPIVFSVGTTMAVGDVTFELPDDVTFPAGSVTMAMTLSNSFAQEDNEFSDGSTHQTFTTTESPVVEDSWSVEVDGFAWTEVETLMLEEATKTYDVSYNADETLTIKFGDGQMGKIPPNGAAIKITYRTGGGVEGNIIGGAAEGVEIVGYVGTTTVGVTFTNPNKGSGGADRETLEELKTNIPAWIRTVDKAITIEDYETLSMTFEDPTYGAVARAKAKLRESGYEANIVDIYIWAYGTNGYEIPSTGLKQALHEYLHGRRVATVTNCIKDGALHALDLNLGEITVDDRYALATVETAINMAIDAYFDSTNFQPGQAFRISDFYHVVDAVSGVEHFKMVSPTADVEIMDVELIIKGTVTFTVVHPDTIPPSIGDCP